MRADRLLSILLLLQARGQVSARALAAELEVSERTIYRDVEALGAAGVPVYAERGRHGGCRLLPGYRTDATGLTTDEARALFAFAGQGAPGGAEVELRQALRKLLAGMPTSARTAAEQTRGTVVVEAHAWHREGDAPAHLTTVREAVWQGRVLRLSYRTADAAVAEPLTVDPYGLLVKSGLWYLIAGVGGQARLLRVSRVDSAQLADAPAARPRNLDLEALWRQLRSRLEDRGPGTPVALRVRPAVAGRLSRLIARQLTMPSPDPLPLPDGDGWIALRLSFVALGAATAVLAGFGPDVIVDGPDELRAGLAELGRGLAALYG